jgi:hypothetical protein
MHARQTSLARTGRFSGVYRNCGDRIESSTHLLPKPRLRFPNRTSCDPHLKCVRGRFNVVGGHSLKVAAGPKFPTPTLLHRRTWF